MIVSLLRKELQQHWIALLLVAILSVAGNGLMVLTGLVFDESGSIFESLGRFLRFLVPLSSLVLSHRLVAAEYGARTQLFLEALPVSRGAMVAVKYGLGLGLVIGIVTLVLAGACSVGAQREAFTPRFIGILALKALSVAWCAYSFFFLMGFLGRYRLGLYLAVLLALAAVHQMTDLEVQRFGPLALLDGRFAFEREQVPWEALRVTWALAAACVLLAFCLALTREGNVAALLAEKMSHREKIFVAVLLLGLMSAIAVLEEKRERAPFDLHDAITEQRAGVVVKVAHSGPGTESASRSLAGLLAAELSTATEYLGLTEVPPVFVTRRRDLDVNRFERGELEEAAGVHVQANFGAPGFSPEDFSGWLMREVLIVASEGRAKFEPRMWVLDGFASFWGARRHAGRPLAEEKTLALRALYGAGREPAFEWRDLDRWYHYRERVGAEIASGVAWSGLQTLARQQGAESVQRFLRAALGARVPHDARAWLHQRSAPVPRLLEREAGLAPEVFWLRWQGELATARTVLASELAQLPALRGELILVPLTADSRRVRYRVQVDRALPPPGRYSFLHHQLSAFDEEVPPPLLRREQHSLAAQAGAELPESVTVGARLYWTFSVEVPALGCPVISGWRREEVR